MLVLTRKIGEKILIGDDIVLTILDGGRGEGIRIGIDAPRNVAIHRSELVEAVSATNQEASRAGAAAPGEAESLILAALGLDPAASDAAPAASAGPAAPAPAAPAARAVPGPTPLRPISPREP